MNLFQLLLQLVFNLSFQEVSSEFETPEEDLSEAQIVEFEPILESTSNGVLRMNYDVNQELMSTIQHTWYNNEYYTEKPASKREEANIGILW